MKVLMLFLSPINIQDIIPLKRKFKAEVALAKCMRKGKIMLKNLNKASNHRKALDLARVINIISH
jgi:hypothetical protein